MHDRGEFIQGTTRTWLRISQSVTAAVAYLRHHLAPTGRFDYIYYAGTNQISQNYNLIRHAGTVMMLYRLVGTRFDDGVLEQHIDRAWAYLAQSLMFFEVGGVPSACIVEAGVARLGCTALTLLALAAKLGRFSARDRNAVSLLTQLARYLTSQQKDNGRFVSKSVFVSGSEIPFDSQYYPGEAILALCAAFRITGDLTFFKVATVGAQYLMGRYDRGVSSAIDVTDHWLMIALDQLHALDRRTMWVQHLRRLSQPLLPNDARSLSGDTDPVLWLDNATTTQIATRAEGLLGALRVEIRLHEKNRANALGQTILTAISRCLERQIDSGGIPSFSPGATGGIVQSVGQSSIRIDYVQHVLGACLGSLESLAGLDLSQRPS